MDDAVRRRIALFIAGLRELSPDARWVRPESLHVTLKFIGEQAPERLPSITQKLAAIGAAPFPMSIRGFGFFPNPKSARVFWIGIESGPALATLAAQVDDALHALGMEKETHAFSPHLTLARGGGRSGSPRRQKADRSNQRFTRLQERLAAMPVPEFGAVMVRQFVLYQSRLSPEGARYTPLATFPLQPELGSPS